MANRIVTVFDTSSPYEPPYEVWEYSFHPTDPYASALYPVTTDLVSVLGYEAVPGDDFRPARLQYRYTTPAEIVHEFNSNPTHFWLYAPFFYGQARVSVYSEVDGVRTPLGEGTYSENASSFFGPFELSFVTPEFWTGFTLSYEIP